MDWLFIHGAGSNADFWLGQQPLLPAASYVNLPGHAPMRRTHGPAAPPAPPLPQISIAAYAAWVATYIAGLGVEDVVLVGHSMGGAVALELALGHPPWLRGLVLANTAARLPVAPALLSLLAHDYAAAVAWLMERYFAPGLSPYRAEGVRRQLLRLDPAVTAGDFHACAAFDVRARLAAAPLVVPTLILGGEAAQLTPPAAHTALAALLPAATLTLLPGAGHMAPLEQPLAWNLEVGGWGAGVGA